MHHFGYRNGVLHAEAVNLVDLAQDIASQRVRVIDLTQTLSPDFPTLILPPQFDSHRRPAPSRPIAGKRNSRPILNFSDFSRGGHDFIVWSISGDFG